MDVTQDCYKCAFRRDLPYSSHSECKHPVFDNTLIKLLTAREFVSGKDEIDIKGVINVAGNVSGIRNGWFFFPMDYDPVWVKKCTGFQDAVSGSISGAVSA